MKRVDRNTMRTLILAIAAGAIVALTTSPGMAQPAATVGGLLDGGGTVLDGAAVSKLYAGAAVTGSYVGRADVRFLLAYKADGTANGSARWPGGDTLLSGTWSVNDKGQICNTMTTSGGGTIAGCTFVLALGHQFYVAKTTDRSEQIWDREFTTLITPQSIAPTNGTL